MYIALFVADSSLPYLSKTMKIEDQLRLRYDLPVRIGKRVCVVQVK